MKNNNAGDIHDYGLDVKNRIIYLHAIDDTEVGYKMSANFTKNLITLDKASAAPIEIHIISSDGGDLSHAIAMYSAIKSCRSKVHAICYGRICSAMTVLVQAADYRTLHKHTDFMIHYGSISLDQNSLGARSTLRWDGRLRKMMLEIYSERCVKGPFFASRKYTEGRVRSYLDRKMKNEEDVWMSSEDAVDYGFADEVI